eukprot:g1010.t1
MSPRSEIAVPPNADLYRDKPNVQTGRLLETISERRQWVSDRGPWHEWPAENVFFENKDAEVAVTLEIPALTAAGGGGAGEVRQEQVVVWFTDRSLEVRVEATNTKGRQHSNYVFLCRELWGHIDPDKSSWKLVDSTRGRQKLKIKLMKGQTGRSMDKWDKLRRL